MFKELRNYLIDFFIQNLLNKKYIKLNKKKSITNNVNEFKLRYEVYDKKKHKIFSIAFMN